jgi:hypothetical protein
MKQCRKLCVLVMALALAAVYGSDVNACSPGVGYVRPTNFDLVRKADVIVVASANLDGATTDRRQRASVRFRTDIDLKGNLPKEFERGNDVYGNPAPSDPDNLLSVNPEAMSGACHRYLFRRNDQYVLFLTKGKDGTYSDPGYSFVRDSEDFSGEGSAWVRAIRLYIAIQELPLPIDQLRALGREYEKLTGADASKEDRAIAADIAVQAARMLKD